MLHERAERGKRRFASEIFGDSVTIRSDVGQPAARQTPIGPDGPHAEPMSGLRRGIVIEHLSTISVRAGSRIRVHAGQPDAEPSRGSGDRDDRSDGEGDQSEGCSSVFLGTSDGRSEDAAQPGRTRRPVPHRERRDRPAGAELRWKTTATRAPCHNISMLGRPCRSHRRSLRFSGTAGLVRR